MKAVDDDVAVAVASLSVCQSVVLLAMPIVAVCPVVGAMGLYQNCIRLVVSYSLIWKEKMGVVEGKNPQFFHSSVNILLGAIPVVI